MKIAEARQIYNNGIRSYREQQNLLLKRKQELEKQINTVPDGANIYAEEAATLELSINAVKEKGDEYQQYMDKLLEQWCSVANMVSAKQQGEAMEEYGEDMVKIMEVARRLMKGGVVPPSDEKKLMEFSMELYQAAKNIGALAREREEYDSLWEDEEEKQECEDPATTADNTEAFAPGPEIVEVADMLASVPGMGEQIE